ncbi:MAG TPA: MATE family efflux transporter [Lachnospiraceae bacterium]|nr:MATE family efflux transporter [Lachnospiraceae bacterium]
MTNYEKMTETPVPSLIGRLSIPTIISMMATTIYNLVDTAFVGRLGNSASGAVGIVFGYMTILQAIGFMFGQGSGSIISRRLGARKTDEASRIASTGFFLAFAIAVLTALFSFLFLDGIIELLGSTPTIAPYARTYLIFILCAAPFSVTSFVLNNILRFEGKAMFAMAGLLTGGVINIAGDAVFMFGLKMGIAGAGLSTALSQFFSFCILLSMFIRHKTTSVISLWYLLPDRDEQRFIPKRTICRQIGEDATDIIATGVPSLLRQLLNSVNTILLNSLAGAYGDEAIAAMSIVSRVAFFIFSIALGIGQGFQPVAGFNFGAKRYSRVRQGYRFTILLAETLIIIMSAAVLAGSGNIIRIFRDDEEVIRIGTRALRLQVGAQILLPVCMATEMLMQSTGQRLAAAVLSALRGGVFFIPALLILSRLRGLYGIEEAQPVAFLLAVLPAIPVAYLFFKRMPEEDGKEMK